MTIALICSVQAEAEHLLSLMTTSKSRTVGSKSMVDGMLFGTRVLLLVGGMGKVNAAHAATLLARREPGLLVVFGIGGAYPSSGAHIGDVAIATEEIAADEGVLTLDGFKDTTYIGIPLVKTSGAERYNLYPAPDTPWKRCRDLLLSCPDAVSGRVHTGAFVTLSTCTGTAARAKELEERHRALCENMEGAAVAQVAELHKIPWIEVRGISNIVEDRDLVKWDIPSATRAAQQAVQCIVEGWNG